jgi:hypothetical protein
MSFRAEFQMIPKGPFWSLGQDARFALPEEAENFAHRFKVRFAFVRAWRVAESRDAATHRWNFVTNTVEKGASAYVG